MSKDMVKLTGLWKEKDQNGKSYLTGSLNHLTKVLVLPNSYKKEGEKSPDFYLFVSQIEKKPKAPRAGMPF